MADSKGLLKKEQPFTLMEEGEEGENYLVQGIIDCYFSENVGGTWRTVAYVEWGELLPPIPYDLVRVDGARIGNDKIHD